MNDKSQNPQQNPTDTANTSSQPSRYRITVKLAGRPYTFVADNEGEELIRKSFSLLEAKMSELDRYKFPDPYDKVVTAAMQCIAILLREKKKDIAGTLLKEMKFLDKQLGDYIENNLK